MKGLQMTVLATSRTKHSCERDGTAWVQAVVNQYPALEPVLGRNFFWSHTGLSGDLLSDLSPTSPFSPISHLLLWTPLWR